MIYRFTNLLSVPCFLFFQTSLALANDAPDFGQCASFLTIDTTKKETNRDLLLHLANTIEKTNFETFKKNSDSALKAAYGAFNIDVSNDYSKFSQKFSAARKEQNFNFSKSESESFLSKRLNNSSATVSLACIKAVAAVSIKSLERLVPGLNCVYAAVSKNFVSVKCRFVSRVGLPTVITQFSVKGVKDEMKTEFLGKIVKAHDSIEAIFERKDDDSEFLMSMTLKENGESANLPMLLPFSATKSWKLSFTIESANDASNKSQHENMTDSMHPAFVAAYIKTSWAEKDREIKLNAENDEHIPRFISSGPKPHLQSVPFMRLGVTEYRKYDFVNARSLAVSVKLGGKFLDTSKDWKKPASGGHKCGSTGPYRLVGVIPIKDGEPPDFFEQKAVVRASQNDCGVLVDFFVRILLQRVM